jgi:hypothetical protein
MAETIGVWDRWDKINDSRRPRIQGFRGPFLTIVILPIRVRPQYDLELRFAIQLLELRGIDRRQDFQLFRLLLEIAHALMLVLYALCSETETV